MNGLKQIFPTRVMLAIMFMALSAYVVGKDVAKKENQQERRILNHETG